MALACILAATLTPAGAALQPDFSACLLCGARGNADALVNLILFAPLGAALALNGFTGPRPVLAAGILSCCVELAQIVIPGRDPSLGDVCFNTLGAAAGQALFLLGARWLVPAAGRAARLSLAAAIVASGAVALTAFLLAPRYPPPPYFSWWVPSRPEMTWYHGRVLEARLGDRSIRPGDHPLPALVLPLLSAGAPLRLTAIAGPRTPGLAPLLLVEDRRGREVLLVGPDREDLVLRYRTRAAWLRLDQPDIRLRGVLQGVRPGDTLYVTAHREPGGYCLQLNATRTCRLWFTIGSAWALLLYPRHFPPWAYHLLGIGWAAGVLVPVGLWLRLRPAGVLALAVVLWSLAVLPPQVGLNPTPLREWVGAGCGLLIGLALQRAARHRQAMPGAGRARPPGV